MDFEDALRVVENLLLTKRGTGLSDVERYILEGTWEGKTYEAIADKYQYAYTYVKNDVGFKLWSVLAKALGKRVGKKNVKTALGLYLLEPQSQVATPEPLQDISPRQEKSGQPKLEIVWSGTIDAIDQSRVKAIIQHLRELALDDKLTISEVKEGSVILVLAGSRAGLERLLQLYQTGELRELLGIPVEDVRLVAAKMPIDWRQWLQNLREELFDPYWQLPELVLAAGMHKSADRPEDEAAISQLLQRLQATSDETTRREIAEILGEIANSDPRIITALTQILQTASDEETRWQAALSLGKIDPSHPQAGIISAKSIDLGTATDNFSLGLIVAFRPNNQQTSVRVRVEPIDATGHLPSQLKLTLLDNSGSAFMEAEATNRNFIQSSFSGPAGEQFSVQLSLGYVSITEDFIT